MRVGVEEVSITFIAATFPQNIGRGGRPPILHMIKKPQNLFSCILSEFFSIL